MDVEPQPFREHVLRNDEAVRDGDDDRCAELEPRREPLGLEHRYPVLLRDLLGRRRKELAASSCLRVRTCQDAADLVAGCEPLQDVGAERAGCRDRDTVDSPRAEDRLRPEPRESRAPRLVVGAIDDQHAVQVVELVLGRPRRRRLELE